MKIRDVMTDSVVRIDPEESVEVAARLLAHYNIGALPVCGGRGQLCGVVTDRDLVTRCLASGKPPALTAVREVMTGSVISVAPDAETTEAAQLMGRQQIRRLPVVEQGRLCGMVSLGDLANREEDGNALARISSNISAR